MDNRSWESAAAAGAPSAPGAPSAGYPTDGNPSLAIPATIPGAYWFHQMGEEIRAAIVAGGLTPDESVLNQLALSIAALGSKSAVQGAFKNLQSSATGASAVVSFSADELVVENTATNAYTTLRALALSASTGAASGAANSLDTGAWAYSTWYAQYVIYNGTTAALLWSLSATAPTLPSGYTSFARVGWIRTQSATNYYALGFKQYGLKVRYVINSGGNVPALPIVISGVQGSVSVPTWVSASVSAFVPPTASFINGSVGSNSGAALSFMAAPNNQYGAITSATNRPPVYGVDTNGSDQNPINFLLESTNIYYACDTSTGALLCLGWEDSL